MELLIDTYGTKIGSVGERIALSFPKVKEKKEYPIRRLDKIVILRPASITTNAVQLALEHDVDIVYLGAFGKPVGRIFSSEPKGLALLRKAQLEVANSDKSCEFAKALVIGKTKNQICHLRLLSSKYDKSFTEEILQSKTMLDAIPLLPATQKSKEQLLGMEGYIAEKYFAGLKKLHKFPGRKPQDRDKFNSALNYGYGILYNEVERACLYAGLDPYLGLYHTERYGKPALVLDLVEEFRVPIVDSVIFPLFVEKKLGKKKHFEKVGTGEYQLSAEGKSILVEAVLKRLHQTVKWEGKEYSMKQVIGNQIRSMGRNFLGKEKEYVPFDFAALISLNQKDHEENIKVY